MNNLNDQPLKTIKNYLLSHERPTNDLKEKQMELISKLTQNSPLNANTIENYDQNPFKKITFMKKCNQLLGIIPIRQIRNEWSSIVENYDYGNYDKLLMNVGERISLNEEKKIVFEEWRNVIDTENNNKVVFSIHKKFIGASYEIKITGKDFCYILEIGFDGSNMDPNIFINREVHRQDDDDNLSSCTTETEASIDEEDQKVEESNNIFENPETKKKDGIKSDGVNLMIPLNNNEINTNIGNMNLPYEPQSFNNNSTNNNNERHHRSRRHNQNSNKIIESNDYDENDNSQCSGSVNYTRYNGPVKSTYNAVVSKQNDKISSEATFENESEMIKETQKEELTYKVDRQKLIEEMQNRKPKNEDEINNNDEETQLPIIVTQVDTESSKTDNKNDYFETNFETYHINTKNEWGKKRYQNNKNRKYQEDWKKEENKNGEKEEKVQKFLDDGCGKKTTEAIGKKLEGENTAYEYHDTYIYDVATGDETTLKTGKDKINEWNSKNYRNRIKNFNHVENYGKNNQEKLEWTEKWDEDPDGHKYCKKWGKSEFEEWEEEWNENIENEDRIKVCSKKCKKLKEDKEWFETWTEKNGDKENSEKTCYKMNRVGNNIFENYWGNVIVDHFDNKRKKYVGYNTNGDRKEYIDYTYQNTNN